MNKYLKLFLENFLFYGGLSMLQKALPFITLPIITSLLPNSESYGIGDMFNLIIFLGSALAILGMYDAIFREYFEKKEDIEYKKKVTSTGLSIVFISSIFIFSIIIILKKIIGVYLFGNSTYDNLIYLSALGVVIISINGIVSIPTRMRNERKIFFFTGITFPFIGFLITYYFIKIGYTYEALIYGFIFSNFISVIVFSILNRRDFKIKMFDKKVAKELFKIGLPLVPTFIIYWVFNSLDKIMIAKMINVSELGIYSVGSKVASVSQLVYTAFTGGWSYFAFSTMKDNDQVKINSKVFEYLGIISFILFIFIQPFINTIFQIFFEGAYIKGKEVFAYLFLSPLMLMLFQIISNQMIIMKKSYLSTFSLSLGLILNIVLNYILIKNYGIRGAAFSTLLSYILSVILMSLVCLKYKLLILNKKFVFIALFVFIGINISFFLPTENILLAFIYITILIVIIIFYLNNLKSILKNIKNEG